MRVERTVQGLRDALAGAGRVGFVPTMGGLHEGHVALIRRAAAENDVAVISIFVNPLQFDDAGDFAAYPRDEQRDLEAAALAGAKIAFVPDAAAFLGRNGTFVECPEVGALWEGAHRPGHFRGVCTIVAKLFNVVRPHRAYFGLKDLQQCAVIGSMVADLDIPLELSWHPTVRTSSGLAHSSRNARLSPAAREKAALLIATLRDTAARLASCDSPGEPETSALLDRARTSLDSAGLAVQYLALVSFPSMRPLDSPEPESFLIAAVVLEGTRLIDNVRVLPFGPFLGYED